jgi:hypothetical protein
MGTQVGEGRDLEVDASNLAHADDLLVTFWSCTWYMKQNRV